MAAGVEELVNMLFEMIDDAKNSPFGGGKCVIERDRALDLLDDIKDQLPGELVEAQKVLRAREDYLASARRDAEDIRKRAEIEVQRLISEDKVMNQARKRANELIAQAEQKAREVRRSANEYCEDVLHRTEEALAAAHGEMSQVRTKFRAAMGVTEASGSKNSRMYDMEADN